MDKKLHPTIYLQQMNTVQTNNLKRRPEKWERQHYDAKENQNDPCIPEMQLYII